MMDLEIPTASHTLHHVEGEIKAYVCGGETNSSLYLKVILKLDILNKKFSNFGQLNTARRSCGVDTCTNYLWAFGGYDSGHLDSIERVSFATGGIFWQITL